MQAAVHRLCAIGYVHEGNLGVDGREAFTWPKGERRHHLYVSPTDSEELRDDRPGYTEAKTPFVERYSR